MSLTDIADIQTDDAVVVHFPHGTEIVPTSLNGHPVRFATIDQDGSLVAWLTREAPELMNGCGAWVGQAENDLVRLSRVCDGNYPAYRDALREVDRPSSAKMADLRKLLTPP